MTEPQNHFLENLDNFRNVEYHLTHTRSLPYDHMTDNQNMWVPVINSEFYVGRLSFGHYLGMITFVFDHPCGCTDNKAFFFTMDKNDIMLKNYIKPIIATHNTISEIIQCEYMKAEEYSQAPRYFTQTLGDCAQTRDCTQVKSQSYISVNTSHKDDAIEIMTCTNDLGFMQRISDVPNYGDRFIIDRAMKEEESLNPSNHLAFDDLWEFIYNKKVLRSSFKKLYYRCFRKAFHPTRGAFLRLKKEYESIS